MEKPGGARHEVVCLELPDWVTVVALTLADELVLVRQYRYGIDAPSLETPGGIVDPDESPTQAALRELREETGYAPASVESLGIVFANPAIQGNRLHVLLAQGAQRVGEPTFDEHESAETVLVPLAAVKDLLDAGAIGHALSAFALERALRRMVWREAGARSTSEPPAGP
ncbi:MAG: NUDIX hydrolase [Myxococcales bacterium]|nr:NUDIX hydrolase [Myxococcales bacterium]